AGTAIAALSFGLRGSGASLLVLIVILAFEVTSANATWQANRNLGGVGATFSNRDWIDRAVPSDARVAELWYPAAATCRSDSSLMRRRASFWRNEFFNRSVHGAYSLASAAGDNLPANKLAVGRNGVLSLVGGGAFAPRFVVVDDAVTLRARVLAHDAGTRATLYETPGRVQLVHALECRSRGGPS